MPMASIEHDQTDDDDKQFFHISPSIRSRISAAADHQQTSEREWINDLLSLSSLLSHQVDSNHFLSSESRLIHSKFEHLFHFLLNDSQHEPMRQASGDSIVTPAQVDDALIELSRNATLKFRNYKLFREQLLTSSNSRRSSSRPSTESLQRRSMNRSSWWQRRNPMKYLAHRFIHSLFFKWFISIAICFDAITVAITVEYSSPEDSQSIVYNVALFLNRCILFIYLFELIFKWMDNFTNFWYSPVNIIEFLLTLISLINLISEVHFDTTSQSSGNIKQNFNNTTGTFQRIRSYGSILSLLRTLRMLRILRILEIAFRFPQVRIVFLALSRSVKLIFHVVLLTIILNYFFALIALYLTQFGLNTTSKSDMKKIQSLFGTVPRAFITVFRLFTKDEWYEIKLEMYALKIHWLIVDIYVVSWLCFGGYVLNPLLVGAMVGTFDETRKELTQGIKQIISKTRLTLNENDLRDRQSSFSSVMARMNSIRMTEKSIESDQDKLDEWLRLTSDEIRLIGQDRSETQWPLYTAFFYLQILEIYFENLAERQLLFDFISISLLELHDQETKPIDPPILSSSSDEENES